MLKNVQFNSIYKRKNKCGLLVLFYSIVINKKHPVKILTRCPLEFTILFQSIIESNRSIIISIFFQFVYWTIIAIIVLQYIFIS